MAAAKCRNRRRELTDTLQSVSSLCLISIFPFNQNVFALLGPELNI